MKDVRHRFKQIGFLIGFVLSTTIYAEIVVRVHDWLEWDVPFFHTTDRKNDLTISDLYGVRGKPYGRFKKWKLNNYGFRGKDIAVLPPVGVKRIMILGASESFGLYESNGKEFPAQLQEKLSERGSFEVINASLAGLDLPKITKLWKNWASKFGAHIVLIYPTPVFYLDDKSPSDIVSANETKSNKTFHWWPPRLMERISDVVDQPQFVLNIRNRRMILETETKYSPEWFFNAVPKHRLHQFINDLGTLTEEIEKTGSRPILLTHAIKVQKPIDNDDMGILLAERVICLKSTMETILDFEYSTRQAIVDFGENSGIKVIDVSSEMSGHREWFADYAHFSDEGAGKIAEIIIEKGELFDFRGIGGRSSESLASEGNRTVTKIP